MPSPFPGMDPYLEAPEIWPDLHEALAGEMRRQLNLALPSPYYARLEMRPEVGIIETSEVRQRIVPDVAVVRHATGLSGTSGTSVLERPRSDLSQSLRFVPYSEPIRHPFVEIRDPARGHKLVTLIEILSPSNKHPGPDRDAYVRKQKDILGSDASLVEIDLLRRGQHIVGDPGLGGFLGQIQPAPDYVVLVNRGWQRAGQGEYQVFPFTVRDWLPCIPIPLREGEEEVVLDLQFVFNQSYDTGPYRRGAVDYSRGPDPALRPEDAGWAHGLLHEAGLVAS